MTSLKLYLKILLWSVLWAYCCCCFACTSNNDYPLANQYINRYKKIAVTEMHRIGIPASIKLAQGILESDYGRSRLATKGKNHFGIKCKSYWEGDTIRITDDAPMECFRKYPSVRHSYIDHSNFLKYHPYHYYDDLFKLKRRDYKGWAFGLKKAGYATNPKYTSIIINLIKKYDLSRFDEMLPEQVDDDTPQLLTQRQQSIERNNTIRQFAPVDPYKAHYDKQRQRQQQQQNNEWQKKWQNWEQQKQQKLVLKSQPNTNNGNTVRKKYIPPRDRQPNNTVLAQNTRPNIQRNYPQNNSNTRPNPRPQNNRPPANQRTRPTFQQQKQRPPRKNNTSRRSINMKSAPDKLPPAKFDPNIPIVTMDQLKARGQAKPNRPNTRPNTYQSAPKPRPSRSKSYNRQQPTKPRYSRDYRLTPQVEEQAIMMPPPPVLEQPQESIYQPAPMLQQNQAPPMPAPMMPPPAQNVEMVQQMPTPILPDTPQQEPQPQLQQEPIENYASNELLPEQQEQEPVLESVHLEEKNTLEKEVVVLGVEKVEEKQVLDLTLVEKPRKVVTRPLVVRPIEINECKVIVANKELSANYIARHYDLSVKDIYEFNEINAHQKFTANSYIFLEKKKNKAIKGLDTHIVVENESMKDIAQLYGIKLKNLYKKNKMKKGQEPAPQQRISLRKKASRRPVLIFNKG